MGSFRATYVTRCYMKLSNREKTYRLYLWNKKAKCFVCNGEIKKYSDCSIEHVFPRSLGGSSDFRNLSISHRQCNNFRGNILCRVIWENKLVTFNDSEAKAQLLEAWLDKHGLTFEDFARLTKPKESPQSLS